MNNCHYLQENCVERNQLGGSETTILMEGEFQDQRQLDQELEEWLSPRGIQSVHGFFSEKEKQQSIQTEDSAPEGAIISNTAPEGDTARMVIDKWSDKVEGSGDDIVSPLCSGLYKEEKDIVPWSGTDPDALSERLHILITCLFEQ